MSQPDSFNPASHQLGLNELDEQAVVARADLRAADRREYPFPQRYAMYREGRWPGDDEFRWAELCDISARGLGLLLADRPTAEVLVVELGIGTNVSQVLARVVQTTKVTVANQPRYRVGCEFCTAPPTA